MPDRFAGMTRDGDGTHWEGCETVHWDCAIMRLEAEVKRLRKEIGICHKCGKPLAVMEAICWPCFKLWEEKGIEARKAKDAKKDLTP